MNKSVLILSVLSLFYLSTFAQVELTKDPEAKKVLDAASEKFYKDAGIRIKFTYTTDNRQNGYHDTQKGYVFIDGKKFKAIIPDLEIISNGDDVWTYNKVDEEIAISKIDTSEISVFNPQKLFTAYKDGYKYLLIGEETLDGKKYNVVDLYPEDTGESPYSIIRIKINKANNEIYSIKTMGKSGVDYTFEVVEYKPKNDFPEKLFVLDKTKYPADVEIIDMR